jgi:hypothetical protein
MVCVVLMLAAGSWAGGDPDGWLVRQKKLYQLDRQGLERILAEVHRRYPDFQERLRAIALLRLGTPYKLGCLGEEKGRDPGPLFRVDQADCTVFVLTSSAMAHASTWEGARQMMVRLNYYPGPNPVRYENRIHFTEDRLQTSPYFADITARVAPPTGLRTVSLTLNRKRDGGRLLEIAWEKRITTRFLPWDLVSPQVLERLPATAGVAFVRRKNFDLGLVVAHEGMVLDRRDLVHADSIAGQVRRVKLLDYLTENRGYFDGVLFYRFVEGPGP